MSDTEEEQVTTWYTFYSERANREYYYDPISQTVTWIMPAEALVQPISVCSSTTDSSLSSSPVKNSTEDHPEIDEDCYAVASSFLVRCVRFAENNKLWTLVFTMHLLLFFICRNRGSSPLNDVRFNYTTTLNTTSGGATFLGDLVLESQQDSSVESKHNTVEENDQYIRTPDEQQIDDAEAEEVGNQELQLSSETMKLSVSDSEDDLDAIGSDIQYPSFEQAKDYDEEAHTTGGAAIAENNKVDLKLLTPETKSVPGVTFDAANDFNAPGSYENVELEGGKVHFGAEAITNHYTASAIEESRSVEVEDDVYDTAHDETIRENCDMHGTASAIPQIDDKSGPVDEQVDGDVHSKYRKESSVGLDVEQLATGADEEELEMEQGGFMSDGDSLSIGVSCEINIETMDSRDSDDSEGQTSVYSDVEQVATGTDEHPDEHHLDMEQGDFIHGGSLYYEERKETIGVEEAIDTERASRDISIEQMRDTTMDLHDSIDSEELVDDDESSSAHSSPKAKSHEWSSHREQADRIAENIDNALRDGQSLLERLEKQAASEGIVLGDQESEDVVDRSCRMPFSYLFKKDCRKTKAFDAEKFADKII